MDGLDRFFLEGLWHDHQHDHASTVAPRRAPAHYQYYSYLYCIVHMTDAIIIAVVISLRIIYRWYMCQSTTPAVYRTPTPLLGVVHSYYWVL